MSKAVLLEQPWSEAWPLLWGAPAPHPKQRLGPLTTATCRRVWGPRYWRRTRLRSVGPCPTPPHPRDKPAASSTFPAPTGRGPPRAAPPSPPAAARSGPARLYISAGGRLRAAASTVAGSGAQVVVRCWGTSPEQRAGSLPPEPWRGSPWRSTPRCAGGRGRRAGVGERASELRLLTSLPLIVFQMLNKVSRRRGPAVPSPSALGTPGRRWPHLRGYAGPRPRAGGDGGAALCCVTGARPEGGGCGERPRYSVAVPRRCCPASG